MIHKKCESLFSLKCWNGGDNGEQQTGQSDLSLHFLRFFCGTPRVKNCRIFAQSANTQTDVKLHIGVKVKSAYRGQGQGHFSYSLTLSLISVLHAYIFRRYCVS